MKNLLFLVLVILFVSCQDPFEVSSLTDNNPEVVLTVKIENAFTGEALPNERFTIYSLNNSVGWNLLKFALSGNAFSKIAKKTLESNDAGYITYSFTGKKYEEYFLEYKPLVPESDLKYMAPAFHILNNDTENNFTFNLVPTTQLGIHFKSEETPNFRNVFSSLQRDITEDKPAFHGEIELPSFYPNDAPLDTIIYITVMQDEQYTFTSQVKDDLFETENIDKTIQVEKKDISVFEFIF